MKQHNKTIKQISGPNTQSPTWMRTSLGIIVALLLAVITLSAVAPLAQSAEENKDKKNDYSLYQLASNASVYFSEKLSPEDTRDSGVKGDWVSIVKNPAQAGSLLGYADDGNFVKWLFSSISGSSQTIKYEAFATDKAKGVKEYAQFGAAVRELGFDNMQSSAGFDNMIRGAGGALMWLAYVFAVSVSIIFWVFIQLLKLLNPFTWFYNALKAVAPGASAEAVAGNPPSALNGVVNFITDWYTGLVGLSWAVVMPLFIGTLLLSLVMFKKMNRGSAIKKLVVRLVFLGFGLPLLGGMYTGALNTFDQSVLSQSSGPSKVVFSTYVDFERWMNQNRLQVPENASITWDTNANKPGSVSVLAVRNSAFAINSQGDSSLSKELGAPGHISDTQTAWENSNPVLKDQNNSEGVVVAALNILSRYMSSKPVSASDFESKIQASVSEIPNLKPDDLKKNWFVGKSYKNAGGNFGEEGDPVSPSLHPLFATAGGGLTATDAGNGLINYSSTSDAQCGFKVVGSGPDPANCNLSPLAAYNYLNTDFSPDSLTIYSSTKSTSGFTRSFHSAVAQVGSGLTGFMYWANALTLLTCVALLGLFYALGLVIGSLRRTYGVISAVPFATLGSLSGIAKVITYSIAMILEVLLTIFLYMFVSEFLISVPQFIEGPFASFMRDSEGISNVLSQDGLGPILIVVMTCIATLFIIAVTVVLLKTRQSVLKAMDEAVTKIVNKFLETDTKPMPDMPGMSRGNNSGGNSQGGGKSSGQSRRANTLGSPKPLKDLGERPGNGGGKPSGQKPGTNAGGLNRAPAIENKKPRALESTKPGRELVSMGEIPDGPRGDNGPSHDPDFDSDSDNKNSKKQNMALEGQGITGTQGALEHNKNSKTGRSGSVEDTGSHMTTKDGSAQPVNRSQDDRALAQKVRDQGGLTPLGIDTGGTNRTSGARGVSGTNNTTNTRGSRGRNRAIDSVQSNANQSQRNLGGLNGNSQDQNKGSRGRIQTSSGSQNTQRKTLNDTVPQAAASRQSMAPVDPGNMRQNHQNNANQSSQQQNNPNKQLTTTIQGEFTVNDSVQRPQQTHGVKPKRLPAPTYTVQDSAATQNKTPGKKKND